MVTSSRYLNRHWGRLRCCILVLLLVGAQMPGLAETATKSSGAATRYAPLFASHKTLNVRIEAPFSTLMRQRPEDEYLAGKFFYTDTSGNEQNLDLKIRARGRYRLQKKTCNFPPLRLNFRKKQVKGTEFAGQDKLKLVTHCQNNRADYEQYLLREYLAYRILQTVTNLSFSARLLRITYVNSEKNGESWLSYGFVIEDHEAIGDRFGIPLAETGSIGFAELEQVETNLVAVFQYLIGNTDFSFIRGEGDGDCCHNVELYSRNSGAYVPVPYDFDFSGFVNPPYAEPNPKFKLRNVRQRLYRGRCSNNDLLPGTIALFLEKKDSIRQLVVDQQGLDQRILQSTIDFVDDFYDDISSPKIIDKRFLRQCS